MVVLGAAGAFAASAAFGDRGPSAWVGVAVATIAMTVLTLTVLPAWRDPKHGPATGAAVLYAAALLAAAAALVLG